MESEVTDTVATPKRGRRALGAAAAALAVGAAYVGACALAPLPTPAVALDVPASQEFAVDDAATQAAVDEEPFPTAVGWLDGDEVWSNDDAPQPLASITKLVTALVGQQAEPLASDDAGPSYTWGDADAERQAAFAELDGITFPIPVGTEVSRRDMLTLALVPSANDFADAYAYSIFGDNDGFTAAVAEWAEREGFDSLRVDEPSGMADENVASAADVLRITRLVLADPVLADIVRTPRAEFPWGIGEVENNNPLLETMPGAVGVKTGHTEAAGYSLTAASRSSVAERELTGIAVVLGRDSAEERAEHARSLLERLTGFPEQQTLTEEGEHLGTLTSVDGQRVELAAERSVDTVLVPGEAASRTIRTGSDRISIAAPQGDEEVAIRRDGSFTDPPLRWRITHPRELFSG